MVKKSRSHKALRRARQEKRKKQAVSLVLAVLMFGSLFAIVVSQLGSSSQDAIEYKDYTFKPVYHPEDDYNTLQTKINGEKYDFYTTPQEILKGLSGAGTHDNIFSQAQGIVIASDMSSDLVSLFDLVRFEVAQEELLPITGTALTNTSQENGSSVSCKNATSTHPVVELREASRNESFSVIQKENCAQIKFTQETAVYARDYLLYSLLGVF
ncbi:MAG: hypothetical protein ACLFNM_03200 [Candidatus Woesearchaeota archaeon]